MKALKSLEWSDVAAVLGAGAVLYGVSQWSIPAAWVLGGLVLVAVGVAANWPRKGPRR